MGDSGKPAEIGLSDVQLDALKLRLLVWLGAVVAGIVLVGSTILVFVFNQAAERIVTTEINEEAGRLLTESKEFPLAVKPLATLPPGAVVPFNLPKCPEGPWKELETGKGRMILGAGSGNTDELGLPLTERRWTSGNGTTGGLERVELTVGQMPKHDHDIKDPGHTHRIPWGRKLARGPFSYERSSENYSEQGPRHQVAKTGVTVKPKGESQPHDNMPPYIVLTLCERLDVVAVAPAEDTK